MTSSIPLRSALVLACFVLSACQTFRRADALVVTSDDWRGDLVGEFDNHEQVVQARPAAIPQVHFVVTALAQAGWYAWRAQLRTDTLLEATWLLRVELAADGAVVLIPHRPLVADPAIDSTFDAAQWIALDACALRAAASAGPLMAKADAASCATVAPGVGVEAALLPLSIEQRADGMRVRLYADQARGVDAHADARRIRWFGGWAAINGAGANATAASVDWHMSQDLRIGSEGGRTALKWRDGKPSGYALLLERLTYREGNTPVLKLSLVEEASQRAVAYAWANPEATRIGLNLGWAQIGLERATDPAVKAAR